jgi:restriction system protein
MAGIWVSRIELITTTSEIVGHKSGLALTREELARFVPDESSSYWLGADEDIIRIRSEDYEHIVATILYEVGNIPSPSIAPPGISLFHKYKRDKVIYKIFEDIMRIFPDYMRQGIENALKEGRKSIDPTPFIEEANKKYGIKGAKIALELLKDVALASHRSPWSSIRRIEWKDTVELAGLFKSESLTTYYGSFLDQRYIDYLSKNFGDIDNINWRKFEALTCEFFKRLGFHVEIGRGRDDGNIDARIWPRKEDARSPPTLIVQCKRQKQKVGKVVVKALWADMVDENAKSGLIVTTSSLSPGAEKVCTARGYPIDQAKRENLYTWVRIMRTPEKGIFLGQ